MLDLLDARCVRRNEIASSDSSHYQSSPDIFPGDGHARLGELLDLDTLIFAQPSTGCDIQAQDNSKGIEHNVEEQEQEFEFRLFSGLAKRAADSSRIPTQKQGNHGPEANDDGVSKLRIRIRSPSLGNDALSEGKFAVPFRGWQYYFTTPALLSDKVMASMEASPRRKEYEDVAMSGKELLDLAKEGTWPGCRVPWRIIHLKQSNTEPLVPSMNPTSSKLNRSALVHLISTEPCSKLSKPRKKPGKKRRIVLRKRSKLATTTKETDAEKRNRKNRKNKIRRRQKKRAQQAALTPATGDKRSA